MTAADRSGLRPFDCDRLELHSIESKETRWVLPRYRQKRCRHVSVSAPVPGSRPANLGLLRGATMR